MVLKDFTPKQPPSILSYLIVSYNFISSPSNHHCKLLYSLFYRLCRISIILLEEMTEMGFFSFKGEICDIFTVINYKNEYNILSSSYLWCPTLKFLFWINLDVKMALQVRRRIYYFNSGMKVST